jgi:hypothetical protein
MLIALSFPSVCRRDQKGGVTIMKTPTGIIYFKFALNGVNMDKISVICSIKE